MVTFSIDDVTVVALAVDATVTGVDAVDGEVSLGTLTFILASQLTVAVTTLGVPPMDIPDEAYVRLLRLMPLEVQEVAELLKSLRRLEEFNESLQMLLLLL